MSDLQQVPPYTVVVGVSSTSKSPKALEWGVAQARANNGRLIAVRIYQMPNPQATPSGTTSQRIPDAASVQADEQRRLEVDVADVLGQAPDVEVHAIRGGKRRGLIEAARDADLLVIDAPRAPSMSPLLAQRIIYAATCPVVVMPPSISGQPPSAMSRAGRAMGRSALKYGAAAGRPGYRPPLLGLEDDDEDDD